MRGQPRKEHTNVVRSNPDDDLEFLGVELQTTKRYVVLYEPSLLAIGDIGIRRDWGDVVRTDRPAYSVIPDFVVSVVSEIEWPLEASISSWKTQCSMRILPTLLRVLTLVGRRIDFLIVLAGIGAIGNAVSTRLVTKTVAKNANVLQGFGRGDSERGRP